jgi:hypothetical protein
MGQQGIVEFFGACTIPLQDILPVIFSCEGQAAAMGFYTESEFVRAMTVLNCSSETEFAGKKNEIKSRYVGDKALFNRVYKYAFGYMAQGGKFISKELAAMMLGVLVADKYPLAPKAIAFLNSDDVRECFDFLV